jgi:hypothetical protein
MVNKQGASLHTNLLHNPSVRAAYLTYVPSTIRSKSSWDGRVSRAGNWGPAIHGSQLLMASSGKRCIIPVSRIQTLKLGNYLVRVLGTVQRTEVPVTQPWALARWGLNQLSTPYLGGYCLCSCPSLEQWTRDKCIFGCKNAHPLGNGRWWHADLGHGFPDAIVDV